MRIFSYRNKRLGKRILLILGIVLLLIATLYITRFIYLQRFITYGPDGAKLDYSQKITATGEDLVPRDPAMYPFETIVQTGAQQPTDITTTPSLHGYYISTGMLADGVDKVRQELYKNDDYNALIIDVKSIFGNFYYSTELGDAPRATAVDPKQVDWLIKELTEDNDVTVIARFSAFSDQNYALAHQNQALPLSSGALWEGEQLCYWLNPYNPDVQGYLTAIAMELSGLGFDEVLFDDFYFPDSERIVWKENITRREAAAECAKSVADGLLGYHIRVCFGSSDPAVAKYGSRVCITTEDATFATEVFESLSETYAEPQAQVMFLTTSRDTRFDAGSVFRPLIEEVE